MKTSNIFILAFLAISCSSESSSRGAGVQDVLVPIGGACEADNQCEPTEWPGVTDPAMVCLEGICTFPCAGNVGRVNKCEELGGVCESAPSYSCKWL